jgi:MSHA biogenesis protein MshP
MSATGSRRQKGFLVIAAVFLVVVLVGLVGYLMTASTTSQAASAADLNSARAYQAARAGIEWGAFQILRDPGGGTFKPACEAGTATFDLNFGSGLSAFTARITCTSALLSEGGTPVRAYRIVSNACNEPVCPNGATTSSTYVERQMTLSLTR